MNRTLLLLFAAALAAVSCQAKVQVSPRQISFDETLTEQNISQALADFQKKRGTFREITLKLQKCTDADLALAAEKFGQFQNIHLSIQDSPALTSLAPLSKLTALTDLSLDSVGFSAADLGFCSALVNLQTIDINRAPATFKSVAGIEKCSELRRFTLSNNAGPVDLSALSALNSLTSVELKYVRNIDLTPAAEIPHLQYLSLYGSSELDLAPLSASKTLKRIMVYATQKIKDYNALASIRNLEEVHAGLSQMNDLSWAPQLPQLKKLHIFSETYESHEPLGRCAALEDLTIWKMRQTVDVSQFADGLSKAPLKKLNLSSIEIVNEAKLAALAATPLKNLSLSGVNSKSKRAVDLTFVGSLAQLETLNLNNIKAANFSEIGKCRNLRSLHAVCDEFDLTVAASLPKLRTLNVNRKIKAEVTQKLAPRKIRVF